MQAEDIMTGNYPSVDEEDHVSKLLTPLEKYRMGTALVFQGRAFKGIVDRKQLVSSRKNIAEMKMKKVMMHCPKLSRIDDEKTMAKLFINAASPLLPVMEKDEVLGVVAVLDLLSSLSGQKKKAIEIAKKAVFMAETDTIGKAMDIMHHHRDCVPILDKKGKIAGVCSLTDILTRFLVFPQQRAGTGNRNFMTTQVDKVSMVNIPVGNIMSDQVITISENSTVSEAVRTMQENKIHSIIIEEKGALKGMLTTTDLLQLI